MTDALSQLDWQDAPPRRRRRGWVWIVVLVVVAGLAAGAWFLGEAIARGVVTDAIRQQVIGELALPADQDVDVQLGGGAIIPQLIAGELDVVTISSDAVPLGPTTGDVSVRAAGIPIRGEPVFDAGQATVVLTAGEVSDLLALSPDVPIQDARFDGTDVTVTIPFSFLGVDLPIDATLGPSAGDGALVLAPRSYQVAGLTLNVDDLRARFGDSVSAITSDRVVCLATYLPAGLDLQHVAVAGDEIQAQFAIDPRIAADAALRETGACA